MHEPEDVLTRHSIPALAEGATGAQAASQSRQGDQTETLLPDLHDRANAASHTGRTAVNMQSVPRRAGIEKGTARTGGQAKGHAAWQAELRGALRDAEARAAVEAARDERKLTQKALTLLPTSVDNGGEK